MAILPEPTVLQIADGILMAELGHLCIAIWRKDSTMERFAVQKAALTSVVSRHKGKAGFLCVVEESSGVPNDAVRDASSKLFRSLEGDLRAIAMIIEGTGFRSALVRSVASGIVMLMGKRSMPISYASNIAEGLAFLGKHIEIKDALATARVVETLRVKLAA